MLYNNIILKQAENGRRHITNMAAGMFPLFCVILGGEMMASKGRKDRYENYVKPHLKSIPMWMQTMTEAKIAKRLGIAPQTFCDYKNKHPELAEAVKRGRQDLVTDVKNALIMRARGFEYNEKKQYIRADDEGAEVTYTEVTTKYALPDVAACNSILQNLDDNWYRDKAQARLRAQELKLKEKVAAANNWLDDDEEGKK